MSGARDPTRSPPGAGAAGSLPGERLRRAARGPLAARLPRRYMEQHLLLPVELTDEALVTAVAATPDAGVLDELAWVFGRAVAVETVPEAELLSALAGAAASDEGDGPRLVADADEAAEEGGDLRQLANQAPVIRRVNVLILDALRARASDVHLESTPGGLRVRMRIDGVLHDVPTPGAAAQRAAVISRIKVMAQLDIAERRLPQDGRIRLQLPDREVDLRVSTLPSLHGESVVLRVLDHGAGVRDLDSVGLEAEELGRLRELIRQPHGIVLVTGPTGSGKTTTLYGALREINEAGVKIVTVEDPVEYQLEGVTQVPVNPRAGLTFAAALRSILRHDPDVVMVGETRDPETAAISIQAALTGHFVFSTLHTNDALGGVARLLELGVEPYLVAATVRGIVAQRLVRTVCPQCAEAHRPEPAVLRRFPASRRPAGDATFRRGRGCDGCAGTGYRGRTGIYELLPMTESLRGLIARAADRAELRAAAESAGLRPLWLDGWRKAAAGTTTLEEVLRVTRDEESP